MVSKKVTKPRSRIEDCSEDEIPDGVRRRRTETRAAEAASIANGGNVIDECGVLCDLDTRSIAELRDKLAHHPEYLNRSLPRDRAQAVLERKLREKAENASAEGRTNTVDAMTAKEYVAHVHANNPHGGYDLAGDYFEDSEVVTALDKMNVEHALVKVGNAVRYLAKGYDHAGRQEFRFLTARDMQQLYASTRLPCHPVSSGSRLEGKGKNGHDLFSLWDRWEQRKELEGVGFFPGSEKHPSRAPRGYLNMWSGLSTEPEEGDWSLFRAHLRDKVCAGDEGHFNFLMDWLAHAVQKPQEKPGCAIVLKSAQKGSGKSMLLKFLRPIFGRHLYTASKIDQLTGKFNGHLEETLIFGIEEGFWAGSKTANSSLKDLITGEHIAIERKGLDSRSVPNFTRFIFLSNESWVVPAGTDERRYFVLDFEHERAKDPTYFDPIFNQMEERGGVAAMLYDLMNREIKANLRNPPTTRGLLQQREQSLEGVERFLLELATEGEIVSHTNGSTHLLKLSSDPSMISKAVVYDAARPFMNRFNEQGLRTSLGTKLTQVGVRACDVGRGSDRKMFAFPSLDKFRNAVSKLLGLPIEGDPVDEGEGEYEIASNSAKGVVSITSHKKRSGFKAMRATGL